MNQSQNTGSKKLVGVVVSDKMLKTKTVAIVRLKKHPKYQKYFKVTKKFKAHDERNEFKTGDHVIIREVRPISRGKRWEIVEKIESRK